MPTPTRKSAFTLPLLILAVLAVLFWRSFSPNLVHFSNDNPLGQQNASWSKLPAAMTGMWDDQNDVGFNVGGFSPGLTALIKWSLGPVGMAKFYAPIALFIVGLGAMSFFRALKLSPLAVALGSLAAVLNSTFFSAACWGVAGQQIALGMDFFALALVVANTRETPWLLRWTRLALAGFCVGLNVMEAADIGALYSLIIAGFVFYKSLVETDGPVAGKALRGLGRVALVAGFAGFIGFQTVSSLVGTQIEGVAGTTQDAETKAEQWDWATQWSTPKKESLGLLVPGLFGYKMDTPNNMMPALTNAYSGGEYWGSVGRSPALDRWLDNGSQGNPPPGFMRFSGGGNYCGILVCLIAAWTMAQSFRRKNSPFTNAQKKMIWFWAFILVICLPLAWGRFAPFSHTSDGFMFYALLYKLPYFSTIRNPAKFLIFLSWAMVILFAYGLHVLSQRQLSKTASSPGELLAQLKRWWARADGFDRKWTQICLGVFVASVLGWLIFSGEQKDFIAYLQTVGFPDTSMASAIATFSLGQLGWFVVLLAIALGIFICVLAGCFSGPRARLGALLLGVFLVFDLGRADVPYIGHWDYKQKYEVGTLNPIVDFLRQKPYEHRVAGLPFRAPEGMELFDQIYRIEWTQQLFPYYDIQCLDIIQMPRMANDLKNYLAALSPRGTAASVPLLARHWELTNTRYLLGAADYLEALNQELDPVQKRFRIQQRFEIVPKPGIVQPHGLEELTAAPDPKGRYALFDFTGALPRASLYGDWQVNTNNQSVLNTLADLDFHPHQTVLVDTPERNLPASATNENTGTVTFTSYAPKHIVLAADAKTPSVLLLNDKYDPNWRVSVDGAPAQLLRCNYLMRGVFLQPGQHTVKFDFSMPNRPLYVTFAAIGIGIILCGFLLIQSRKTGEAKKNQSASAGFSRKA